MSIDTWKKEFYKEPANTVSKKDALAHSLQKWLGLRPKNLVKHGLAFTDYHASIREPGSASKPFGIHSGTCALCVHYIKGGLYADDSERGCKECPLYAVRKKGCDESRWPGPDSPYRKWTRTGNPEPMIRLIKKAIAREAQGPGTKL